MARTLARRIGMANGVSQMVVNRGRWLRLAGCAAAIWGGLAHAADSPQPGCEQLSARQCLDQALVAMGGRERLLAVHNERYESIGYRLLTEQSYRQQPFIAAYEHDTLTIDFDKARMSGELHTTWPEADPHGADISRTMAVSRNGGSAHVQGQEIPSSRITLDGLNDTLALDPVRLLLTADASTVRYAPPETLRDTQHAVLAFDWQGQTIRILLNATNHLPDAFESARAFNDYWFAWGDVDQRVYLDNWKLVHGLEVPTNLVEERNGVLWQSNQLLDIAFNVPLDEKAFAVDPKVAAASLKSPDWNRPFDASNRVELAPGIELFKGSWNATIVRQDDGVIVLEAPIAPSYTKQVLAHVRQEYPGLPMTGVLSSSDSWPHMAGVREAVAEGVPVYVLDLNRTLLQRLVDAPHRIQPDALAQHPVPAQWHVVAGRTEVGHGANRAVIYPLRGASTERQYMVYFPARKLLYASDTLVFNADHSLYDPELMHEVIQAVAREHLQVDTVYAMHEDPTPWNDVLKAVTASLN